MMQSTLARMRKRYTTPRTRDRGQTAFEYLGIILVVVVIIGAIVGTGIGQAITNKIKDQITAITAGK
ncbi:MULTISPECIES: hypothetical protein [Streptomyces]|uniref:hypothetical protein n=1 Tax=Streptomyces TaxID=1883 RepID=UPI001673E185|nr:MULTISPECIES: hypothetical protein [Streptomyces]MBD3576497.1 hypothetical protein [Streptomyces sp. KD18]GGS88792.1 hypothetical protein GCM10010286_11900 [Streptomyces toxytricini]